MPAILSTSSAVPLIIRPRRPARASLCFSFVTFLALPRMVSRSMRSLAGISRSRPARFIMNSRATSELISVRPSPVRVLFITKSLPEPGPPARKIAFSLPGSLMPSVITDSITYPDLNISGCFLANQRMILPASALASFSISEPVEPSLAISLPKRPSSFCL